MIRAFRRVMPAVIAGTIAIAFAAWPASAQQTTAPPQDQAPEAASGFTPKPLVEARRHMAVAAHPLASEAGRQILAAGGSAIDAAVAIQMVLTLVEPQSSGIGGGAFLVHWLAAEKRVRTYDGRETAPMAATPERFLQPDGKPLPFRQAVASGLSVGVPGVLRALELAHRTYGRLPWARLFEPAIALAEGGFPLSPRLYTLLLADIDLRADDAARAHYYLPSGMPKPIGAMLANPALAATLRAIATEGPDVFYKGEIARDIVAAVAHAPRPGDMTLDDLARYRAVEREPVCGPYRAYMICGMGPPSSGGLTVLQILAMIERFEIGAATPMSLAALHPIGEAMALAFADRGLYMGDADFVPVPVKGLLDPDYLKTRGQLIAPGRAMGGVAQPGTPPRRAGWHFAPDPTLVSTGTSHVSIVDGDGNGLSMTTTIESAFGSRRMVRGFLLNNELTDFSLSPVENGQPVANRVEPGKRPRSSMSPTIVLQNDRPVFVVGSPGGSAIINYVAKLLVALIDWRLDPAVATALPNFGSRNTGAFEIEGGTALDAMKPALETLGHRVRAIDLTSGSHVIAIGPAGLRGGADPRREGTAAGD
jgi:gamma-glutamyltranspeptidase/glutathione hydrolase